MFYPLYNKMLFHPKEIKETITSSGYISLLLENYFTLLHYGFINSCGLIPKFFYRLNVRKCQITG